MKRTVLVMFVAASAWLLFAGNLTLPEISAAVLAGAATAWAGYALRKRTGHRLTGLKSWVLLIPVIGYQALLDCWTVTVALFHIITGRHSTGKFRRIRFDALTDSPGDTGRRILATIGTSLQPNSYVVGFNRERGEVLIHELVPGAENPVSGESGGAE